LGSYNYPLKNHELLSDRTDRVFNALKKLAAPPETPVWLVDDDDRVEVTSLGDLTAGEKDRLNEKTILLPPCAGVLEKLQRKYGLWGLAYLESLLRAADWAASANPSEYVEDDVRLLNSNVATHGDTKIVHLRSRYCVNPRSKVTTSNPPV